MAAEAVNGGGGGGRGGNRVRMILWGGAAALLVAPAVAMRFTPEVNWTASDFVFAAAVFGTVGLLGEAAARMSRNRAYRAGAALAIAAAFLIVWSNAAVGMIGSEDNGYNLGFFAVIAVALAGAAIARFRAGGMVAAMLAAGVAQVAVALGGYSADWWGATLSALLALPWMLAAAAFARAARDARG